MKVILCGVYLVFFFCSCSIQSSKLIGTAWVVDLEAYADKEQVPEGLDRRGFCFEYGKDSAYSGTIYRQLNSSGDTVIYYRPNINNKISYNKNEIITYSNSGDTAVAVVKQYKINKYLHTVVKLKGQDKIVLYLKPAPDFDRSNRPKYEPLPPPRLEED